LTKITIFDILQTILNIHKPLGVNLKQFFICLSGAIFGILALIVLGCLIYLFVPVNWIVGFLAFTGFVHFASKVVKATMTGYFFLLKKLLD
jgi:hypothetical protein